MNSFLRKLNEGGTDQAGVTLCWEVICLPYLTRFLPNERKRSAQV